MNDAQARELEVYRARVAFYGGLWERIRSVVPGIVQVKGLDIARHYPAGALRSAADLDLHCNRRQLWQVGSFLAEEGWQLVSFSLARSVRGVEIYVVYRKQSASVEEPARAAAQPVYEVELKTLEFVGGLDSLGRFAPMPSSIVRSVMALLAERREQQFRSRDLLDLAVLLHGASEGELASLPGRLDAARLWPEWWEASRKLVRLGWCPPRAARLSVTTRGHAMRLPGVRALGGLREWGHPVRAAAHLLRRTADADCGPWADRMSTFFHERGCAERAFAAGMTLYGVGLDGEGVDDDLGISSRGPHVVATTPLGSFLMVCGAAREEWLARAREVA